MCPQLFKKTTFNFFLEKEKGCAEKEKGRREKCQNEVYLGLSVTK